MTEESKGKERRVILIILGEALYLSENGLLNMQEIQSAHEEENVFNDCEIILTIKATSETKMYLFST